MKRIITENQMIRLYELVPDYFGGEWILRSFFELFAKDKGEETDKLVDMFIEEAIHIGNCVAGRKLFVNIKRS